MQKIEEYLQHAAQCRDMARTARPHHRQQLEAMADTWEQLAADRKAQIERQKRIARLGERTRRWNSLRLST